MNTKIIVLVGIIVYTSLSAACSDEDRDDCVDPKPEHVQVCCDFKPFPYCPGQDMDTDIPDMDEPDTSSEDMGPEDMPEDEGLPDQGVPCDGACDGNTPICDTDTQTCVACLTTNDCGTGVCNATTQTCVECLTTNDCGTGVCDTTANACVPCLGDNDCTNSVCIIGASSDLNACKECRTNAECTDAGAATCGANNECQPCATVNDCSHLEDLAQCVAGTCRECTTATEATDCGGNVCDPTTYTCTNEALGSSNQLETCVSDTQCATGSTCIALTYAGNPHGNYCMPFFVQGGSCEKPYGGDAQNKTSVNGAQVTVCMINEITTPEAIIAYGGECENGDSDCPTDAGVCREFNSISGSMACTYPCDINLDCQGLATCQGVGNARYCRPPLP